MKYVIMGQLAGIGGWQLYIDARATYLNNQNYDVYLISISKEKEIKLTSFLNFERLCIPEVHMPPTSYTKRQQKYILHKIYSFLGPKNDEMTIESTDMNLSMWGELIAKHFDARNFSYLLHSHFPPQNIYVQDFFLFKYNRDELAGMSELTLPELFYNHPYSSQIEPRSLPAAPKDPITEENLLEDATSQIKRLKQNERSFVIGYFGNLDKPHFSQLCMFIEDYAKTNFRQQFIFVSVGSSGNGKAEKKQKNIENIVENCRTINIPSMYPIPAQIFRVMDVCLASWGCAENSARAGALTVRLLDDVTIIPHGIMGITISDYKSPRCTESLKELIDKILANEYLVKDAQIDREPYDYTITHKLIDQSIFNVTHKKEYYNIRLIKRVSTRSTIEKILNSVFRIRITQGIIGILKNILAIPYAKLQRKQSYVK